MTLLLRAELLKLRTDAKSTDAFVAILADPRRGLAAHHINEMLGTETAAAGVAGSVLKAAPIKLGGHARSAGVVVRVSAAELAPSELHRRQSEGEQKQEGPEQLNE